MIDLGGQFNGKLEGEIKIISNLFEEVLGLNHRHRILF